MKAIFLTEQNRSLWDDFCLSCDEAWFWHTSYWLDFLATMRASHKDGVIEKENAYSKSFYVIDHSNNLVAIIPLILVNEASGKVVSYDPMPAAALQNKLTFNQRKDVLDFIFNQIDIIASTEKMSKICFQMYETFRTDRTFNYYQDYGYISYLYSTLLLDLGGDINEIWTEIRRSHKRHIKKLEEGNPLFKIYDNSSIDETIFERYKILHHEDAGRITRPDRTFHQMYEMIKKGYAVLMELSEGDDVSYYYMILYKQYAYSASICERKARHASLRPKFEWEAIKYIKSKNCRYYELGMDYRNSLYKVYSNKEKNISVFKEGFSNLKRNIIINEKYYKAEDMETNLAGRYQEFILTMNSR